VNYVSACYHSLIGLCSCGSNAAGAGSTGAQDLNATRPNSAIHAILTDQPMEVRGSLTDTGFGVKRIESASYRAAGGDSRYSTPQRSFEGVAHHALDGGGNFGGAPSPELNAGMSLLLVAVTVAVLRRRRCARSA
jgi:hypothetical protein